MIGREVVLLVELYCYMEGCRKLIKKLRGIRV